MVPLLMNAHNSTSRFSERADNYDLYRPGYPAAIIPYLEQTIGLNKTACIADIGSGTGIFSSIFLNAGYGVKAVEPNAEMCRAAEKNLQHHTNFQSIHGTAEHTTLPHNAVDLITVAQAFHWFNQEEVKKEFKRVLKPGGYVLLVWNRLQTVTPFLKDYSALKEKYTEKHVHSSQANLDDIRRFFYPNPVITHQLQNIQLRDAEGLKGLLLSSSKIPLAADSRYADMVKALAILSEQYAENGLLKIEYATMLFLAGMDLIPE